MPRYISIGRLDTALQALRDSAKHVFVDFLILKYHGLTPGQPITITTRSTVPGCSQLMRIERDDDSPSSQRRHYYNPLKGSWLHSGYPRSGTYTTVERSNTFAPVVDTEIAGSGMNVRLKRDYLSAARESFQKRKGVPPAVPLGDLACWALRYESFDDAATITNLTEIFSRRFNLSTEEIETFFSRHDPTDMPFSDTPLEKDALIGLLDGGMTPSRETDQPIEDLPTDLFDFLRSNLIVDDITLRQLATLVRSGKNILLTGPPGTGKTTLSINLARAAAERADDFSLPNTSGWILTTATADWSTFDTIGGYLPRTSGPGLEFHEGIFLRAIRENKWLIVDELNRADADKAFGQLFTVLSGQAVEIPFKIDGHPISIRFDKNLAANTYSAVEGSYKVGRNWRLLATMNTFDRSSLFQLSFAFVRRFAVLSIDIPSSDKLKVWMDERGLAEPLASQLKSLIDLLAQHRPLGPAILSDIADYLESRVLSVGSRSVYGIEAEPLEANVSSYSAEDPFWEAVVAYVIPQLDGLDVETLKRVRDGLLGLTASENHASITRYFRDLFLI